MSTLENLFRYAKASKAHARENFTTEALAGCIRNDPHPLLECLNGLNLWSRSHDIEDVVTQLPVPGVGYIDLVVIGSDADLTVELWGELKVDAGQSGDQISRYMAHIASVQHTGSSVALFSISRSPFSLDERVPHLSWHQIGRAVRRQRSPAWSDFLSYLAENGMTDTYDDAPTAAEISAASAFDALVGKVARIIELAFEEANRREIGGISWPVDRVRKELVGRFAAKGNLLAAAWTPGPRTTSWVVLGVVPSRTSASLSVWVETWPSRSDLQREIHRLALGSLTSAWERKHGHWGGLRASSEWLPDTSHEVSTRWLIDRLEELAAAGIFETMQSAGAQSEGPDALALEP